MVRGLLVLQTGLALLWHRDAHQSLEAEALVGLGPPSPGFRAWLCPESPDATDLPFPGSRGLGVWRPSTSQGRKETGAVQGSFPPLEPSGQIWGKLPVGSPCL